MSSIYPHKLKKTKQDCLDIYRPSKDAFDGFGVRERERPPVFVKIKANPHDLEVYCLVLLLLSPFFILFVRVFIFDIPIGFSGTTMRVPGVGTNLLLLALGGACWFPLMMILGHDEHLLAGVEEQWCLFLNDEIIFIEKRFARIFVPFNQKYFVQNIGRTEIIGLEFIPGECWRRAGGTCSNPDVAARFISWRLAIELGPEAEVQITTHGRQRLILNRAEFDLGDISYDSVKTMHTMVGGWISADIRLKPLPPLPDKPGQKPA